MRYKLFGFLSGGVLLFLLLSLLAVPNPGARLLFSFVVLIGLAMLNSATALITAHRYSRLFRSRIVREVGWLSRPLEWVELLSFVGFVAYSVSCWSQVVADPKTHGFLCFAILIGLAMICTAYFLASMVVTTRNLDFRLFWEQFGGK